MSLHLCIECATIWDIPQSLPRTCPRCERSLELREEMDNVATLAEVASWALFGLPEHRLNNLKGEQ